MSEESETVFVEGTSTGIHQRVPAVHQNGASRCQENELYDRLSPVVSNGRATGRPSTSSQSALFNVNDPKTKVTKLFWCLQRALPLASIIMALVALIMSTLVISGAVTTTQSKSQILQAPGM